jgi:hypothetical protein
MMAAASPDDPISRPGNAVELQPGQLARLVQRWQYGPSQARRARFHREQGQRAVSEGQDEDQPG